MNVIIQLALVGAGVLGFGILLWHSTDPDPKHRRAVLSQQEIEISLHRMKWAESVLMILAREAGLNRIPSFGLANFGAHYRPIQHRVCVSRALLARLSDTALRLILAHEVGHATRRWQAFIRSGAIEEEFLADRMALLITGASPEHWESVIQASIDAEPNMVMNKQLKQRASALGLHNKTAS